MTILKAIEVLKTEIKCVKNADCPRYECNNCYLAMPEHDVLEAYEMAIQALEESKAIADYVEEGKSNG